MEISNFRAIPVYYLVSPEHRIYFYYLISSFTLATLYYFVSQKSNSLKEFLFYFFNPKVLFHSSSRSDLYLLIFNFWVKVFLIAPVIFTQVTIMYLVKDGLKNILPNFNPIFVSTTQYSILYTLVFFVTSDFSRYILHYALHKVSFLWEIHKIHHSAKVLTPLTLYRVHPIEAILFLIRQIIVVGFIAGIFSFFIEGDYPMITIFGVQALGFLFNFFGSNLRHSHVPFTFGHILESVFVSPIMHQMHHSKTYKKNSKNLGSCLAIWDILFKTYLRPDFKPIRFGLSKSQRKNKLVNYMLNPLAKLEKK